MSSIDDDEIENTLKNGIHERKPTYVKRLNFGQPILNLNTVDRPSIFSSNNFIISSNVARIPNTRKEDFVRQWVEAHNSNNDLSGNESNQSSPVLGASKLKQIETSPILGACNYQNRSRLKSGDDLIKNEIFNCIETSPILGSLTKKHRKRLHFTTEKKHVDMYKDDSESVKSNSSLTNSRHDNLPNANVNSSPILIRDAYYYKRKRRRTISNNDQAHKLNTAEKEADDGTDKNMNLLVPVSISQDLHPLSPEIPNSTIKHRIKKDMLEEKKIKKSSSKDNISNVIESVSSGDSNAKEDDSNCDDIIEDTDTQETVLLTKTPISRAMNKWSLASPKSPDETFYSEAEANKSEVSSGVKNKGDAASSKGSDATYFSKAESALSVQSMLPSNSQNKISQVTTFSNDSTDGISSQTNFAISNVTSPVRTNSWSAASLQLIDSCEKKRRVKKKSLAGKLQTLISKQRSFVRLWHHQMKQADMDGISMPHIVVYVDKYTVHLYRQLLEGVVLDDPFNILNNNKSNEKSNISKLSSTKQGNRMITLFIIPDIIGKIEITSESIVKVYPPWDVMDKSGTILNVTYIKLMSNEQRNLILNRFKVPDRKKDEVLIKEFNCLCLEADKILPSCQERLNSKKPDVMKELFKF